MIAKLKTLLPAAALVAALLAPASGKAGSFVVGSVAGSLNASVGGQALLPNSVIFSGDHLQVKDGAAVVALENGSRMAFGRNTEAEFNRDAAGVAVKLAEGNVSIYHPAVGAAIRVTALNYTITPGQGYKSVGEVAMLNGWVVVTAKSGTLEVNGAGQAMPVAAGKTVVLRPVAAQAGPQGGPSSSAGSSGGGHSNAVVEIAAVSGGALGAILGSVAISRADSAQSQASSALSAAQAATSAASAATAAANAATQAATAAAAAAVASALTSKLETNALGCELNSVANQEGLPSPYVPPAGFSCP